MPDSGSKKIVVHFGPVSAGLITTDCFGEPSYVSPYLDSSGEPLVRIWKFTDEERYRLSYVNGLEFVVNYRQGKIWASWTDNLSFEDAASYLLGPVLGIFLRLGGETCLHASAMAFDDRAIVFVGPPGSGKSTTAAALNCRGYAVISDDIVLLREDELGRFYVVPSHPFLSLWPESLRLVSLSANDLPRVFPTLEKRRLSFADDSDGFETRTLLLGGVYILGRRCENSNPRVTSLTTQTALMSLVTDTYGTYVLDSQRRARELEVLGRLVSQVPVRLLEARAEIDSLDQTCDCILVDYQEQGQKY